MTAVAEPKVFVSYRREGTAMHAGRLYDALAARFGDHNVFMDLEMAPGVDFVDRITTAVGACRALIVVIGPGWIGEHDGRARIADPDDFVRHEIATALRAPGIAVFPVLVEGARMPDPDQLPPELRPLTRRNAIELSDLRWRYDCQRLMTALDDLLVERAAVATAAPDSPAPPARAAAAAPAARALLPLWLEGVAVAVAAGMLARWLFGFLKAAPGADDADAIASTIALRGVCWAAIGTALAIWLSLRRGERGRVVRRAATGLLLGAFAGALGGAIFSFAANVPDPNLGRDAQDLVQVGALAVTGGLVGLAIGALWIPPRAAAGGMGGLLGGVLVQLATNQLGHPRPVLTFGANCLAIVGFALLGMLLLDVRAAAVTRRAGLAAEPVAP